MKIICKKENDAKQMLELIKHILETESIDYPILKEDLVLEFSLKDKHGLSHPSNDETIYLEEKDLKNINISMNIFEYYYDHDALTNLYNRTKYERDIAKFQIDAPNEFTCIYIDAVGLHEINNHLGHAAGDKMLCSIAEGIRQNFSQHLAYRIGGDEFVIFCFHQTETDLKQAISNLKQVLRQENYEISVGTATTKNDIPFNEIINHAEAAMRYDKTQFYRQDGAKRQLRTLNYKLEKLLLEKQDASQFLNVISSQYKGVYVVDPKKDICRYIFIPKYFKEILEHNNDIFSKSLQTYCDRFVCEKDQKLFQTVFHFEDVLQQIKEDKPIEFSYTKKDGSRVTLQITLYDSEDLDSSEMLWIFMDQPTI